MSARLQNKSFPASWIGRKLCENKHKNKNKKMLFLLVIMQMYDFGLPSTSCVCPSLIMIFMTTTIIRPYYSLGYHFIKRNKKPRSLYFFAYYTRQNNQKFLTSHALHFALVLNACCTWSARPAQAFFFLMHWSLSCLSLDNKVEWSNTNSSIVLLKYKSN